MMNKMKSAEVHLIRFLFMLPLLAVLLIAFRNQQQNDPVQSEKEKVLMVKDTIPTPPQKPARPVKSELPEGVISIHIDDNIATVKREKGQTEKYNLDKSQEKAVFIKKYGELPIPPPPPPPAPQAPPAPPQPLLVNSKGYINTIADNNGECIVIIKNKAGKLVKAIELTEWNKREKQFKEEYGEIPPPPPPNKPVPPPAPGVLPPGIDHGVIIAPSPENIYVNPATKFINAIQPAVSIKRFSTDPGVIYFIDGIKQTNGKNPLELINPDDIERIGIIKDGSAKAIYGGKGSNGLVLITTKPGKISTIPGEPSVVKKEREGTTRVTIKNLEEFEGIILIDGEETKKENINEQLELLNIESVKVWKGEKAVERFGEKGKKGVIEIKTKKKSITTT